MEDKDRKIELPEDDWVVFLPDEEIRAFERAYMYMWEAKKELEKLKEELGVEN